ncbi:methylenetetrahydrofolate reductase [NAD(P)H] [Methylophilaceae bacterium]|nr:methylenetetrahydrofolate reductase [NAD(P)H] [Methylophilaceae bacterium]|tara:strand:+ start:579 stop:1412 length:834 start_codon:yes stop_codon:yes gene_type:complete
MSNTPSVSFEFFPPRTEEGVLKLDKTVKTLSEFTPEFFSVTFGAGGSTKTKTLETVLSIKSSNNNAVPHLSCISASKEDIRNLLNEYKAHDINHLIALRGDNPSGAISNGDFKFANDLISFIREETGEYFHIQAGAYPEYHPEADSAEDDLNNFKRKIEAGANSAITQFFFNADAYFRFIEECQKRSVTVPIIPGIMPIYNIKQLSRFASNCGAEIPRWLRLKLECYDDDIQSLRDYGVDVISELCETLIQYGVPGIHFYTLNESKIVSKIIKNISN